MDVTGWLLTNARKEQTDPLLVWTPSAADWTLRHRLHHLLLRRLLPLHQQDRNRVTINFTGVSLTLVAKKAPSFGIAKITFDGTKVYSVNLYRSTSAYKQAVWSSGWLVPGEHTVTLAWTGTKSGSTGTTVDIDAVDVRGVLR